MPSQVAGLHLCVVRTAAAPIAEGRIDTKTTVGARVTLGDVEGWINQEHANVRRAAIATLLTYGADASRPRSARTTMSRSSFTRLTPWSVGRTGRSRFSVNSSPNTSHELRTPPCRE
jgi:hypothetical protein